MQIPQRQNVGKMVTRGGSCYHLPHIIKEITIFCKSGFAIFISNLLFTPRRSVRQERRKALIFLRPSVRSGSRGPVCFLLLSTYYPLKLLFQFIFAHGYDCRPAVRTMVGIVQCQQLIDQLLRLLSAKLHVALDRRLAGHGGDADANALRRTADGISFQFIQYFLKKVFAPVAVQIHGNTPDGILAAAEFLDQKSESGFYC